MVDRITQDALRILFQTRLQRGERFWVNGREVTSPAEIIEALDKGWRIISQNI